MSREENRLSNVNVAKHSRCCVCRNSVRQENINRENEQLSCYKRDSSQYGLLLVFLSKELKITWCLAFLNEVSSLCLLSRSLGLRSLFARCLSFQHNRSVLHLSPRTSANVVGEFKVLLPSVQISENQQLTESDC